MRLVRGDTQTITVQVTNPDDLDTQGNPKPADIASSELFFTVRPSTESEVIVFKKNSLTEDGGIEILDLGTDDTRGKARISFSVADWVGYRYTRDREFAWDLSELHGGKRETIAGTPLGNAPLLVVIDVTRDEAGES